jgi:hypothetical protein
MLSSAVIYDLTPLTELHGAYRTCTFSRPLLLPLPLLPHLGHPWRVRLNEEDHKRS